MATLIERAEARRHLYARLLADLPAEERLVFEPPPGIEREQPTAAAAVAREWLGLEECNDFAATRLAVEDRGVLVVRAPGYAGAWKLSAANPVAGFTLYDPEHPAIVVKHAAKERQLFTLAHELDHVLLHRESFIDDEADLRGSGHRRREREANRFAAHLLVPDDLLNAIAVTGLPADPAALDAELKEHARRWGVNVEVVLLRLVRAGALDRAQHTQHLQWKAGLPSDPSGRGSRQYRHREPLHLFGRRFVATVFDALAADRMTLNRASGLLDDLKVSDLHQLRAHLADA